MTLITILIYLVIVALGVALLWVSYQVGFGGRLSLIRGSDNKPLVQAELIAKSFVVMTICLGASVFIFAIAIPLFGIQFEIWRGYLAAVTIPAIIWRQVLLMRHTKLLALTRQSNGTQTSLPPHLDVKNINRE